MKWNKEEETLANNAFRIKFKTFFIQFRFSIVRFSIFFSVLFFLFLHISLLPTFGTYRMYFVSFLFLVFFLFPLFLCRPFKVCEYSWCYYWIHFQCLVMYCCCVFLYSSYSALLEFNYGKAFYGNDVFFNYQCMLSHLSKFYPYLYIIIFSPQFFFFQ